MKFLKTTKRFVVFYILLIIVGASSAYADEFISTDFKVLDPVIQPAGYATSSGYQLWSTLSEVALGTSTATSFSLGAGFLRFPLATKPVATAIAGDTLVALSWTASQGYLGLTPSGYNVGQSLSSGGPYSYTSLGNVLSSNRTGLTNGTLYYFIVVAKDAFGNPIATSTEVSATPTAGAGGGGGSVGGGGGIYHIPSLEPGVDVCDRIADLNCDGFVDIVDFSIMYYWFDRSNPPKRVDLSHDGKVDIFDFSIMAYYWTEI